MIENGHWSFLYSEKKNAHKDRRMKLQNNVQNWYSGKKKSLSLSLRRAKHNYYAIILEDLF